MSLGRRALPGALPVLPPMPKTEGLSQYFTPLEVVDLAFDLLQALGPLPPAPRVLDPACGDGAFLLRAAERGLTTSDHLCGLDKDATLQPAWAQERHLSQAHLVVADALLDDLFPPGAFDLVVGNPPFAGQGLRDLSEEQAAALLQRFELARAAATPRGREGGPPALGGPDRAVRGSIRPSRQLPLPLGEVAPQARVRARPSSAPGPLPTARLGLLRRLRIEVLFLERFFQFARPGGHVAIVLPEGILANARQRRVREWLLDRYQLDAVVGLPRSVFRGHGTTARTALLVARASPPAPGHRVALWDYLSPACGGEVAPQARVRGVVGRAGDGTHLVAQADPRLRHRLDPAYHDPGPEVLLATSRYPLRPLGDFIVHLVYGPIITRRQPPSDPNGVVIVHQGQVGFTGVDPSEALRVPPSCDWDVPRCRLQAGDLVLPRSGVASVAKSRVAVFLGDYPATVGSFVDLVRLEGLNPCYVVVYLKTAFGREQVLRVINGVGTPNISFDEIRALRVAVAPQELQQAIEARYRTEVWPRHAAFVAAKARCLQARRPPDDEVKALEAEAAEAWKAVIGELEAQLSAR